MQVKKDCPIDTFDRDFFDYGERLSWKLKGVNPQQDEDRAYGKLIEAGTEINNKVVQPLIRNLNRAYKESDEYRDGAKAVYRLIDMNLRWFQYAKIDDVKNDISVKANYSQETQINQLKNNYRDLLDMIRQCMAEANAQFEPSDKVDDTVVYLVDLAYHIEISVRMYGRHMFSGDGEGVMDYYEIIDEEDRANALQEIGEKEEQSEFVKESQSEMEQMIEQNSPSL